MYLLVLFLCVPCIAVFSSLHATMGIIPWGDRVGLWTYDGRSDEYGEEELREWYPMASHIIVNPQQLGEYVVARSFLLCCVSRFFMARSGWVEARVLAFFCGRLVSVHQR